MKVLGVGEPVRLEDKPRNRCRKWQLIVKVDLGDGKRHRKTRTFRGPYTQAVEATDGYAAELADRIVTSATDISTCIDKFLAHREKTGEVSRRTMRTDREKLAALRLNLGERIAATVTRNDIQDMYADIRDGSTPSGNPWAPRSIIRLHTSLKAFFGWLVEEGAVAENPMLGIRTPKVKDAGVGRAMPSDLMDELLASLDYSKPMHRAVALALACGLRREECTALSWDDLRDGNVHVAWASEEDGERKDPKNGHARAVPVPEDVYEALDAHRSTGLVVGFLPHSVTVWWKKNRDGLGASGYRFHDLRHSWATRFIEKDVQTKKIMDLGGWLSEEPLNSIYAHVSGKEKRDAVRKAFDDGEERRRKLARSANGGTRTAQIIVLKDRRSGAVSS